MVEIEWLDKLWAKALFRVGGSSYLLLTIVGRKAPILVGRCDAFDPAAHRLEQVALEVLAKHIHRVVVAEVLPIWRLLAALGEELVHWGQVSLVVVHAGGKLGGVRSVARFEASLLL